ncbi:hypothetical protein BRC89_02525 [Halobacteriales archaeon QS_4_70_19]|nr:MAG: hypothetical protein BRC89_02525 [Halobacteriales archaeon QS_4_70_19]
MRRLAVVVACWLLLVTAVGPAVAVGRPGADAGDSSTGILRATGAPHAVSATDGRVRSRAAAAQPAAGVVRHTIRLAEPGAVSVELSVGLTTETRQFRVTLPERATVTGTDGFDRVEGTTYEWDGRTDAPSVTYRAPVNRTVGSSTRFAATDDWALVDVTTLDAAYSWRSLGRTSYERRFAVPDGYAGRSMAYLGDYRVANASGAGQRFTVVHPEVVSTDAAPNAYAETLASVAGGIRVGARDPVVTAFVAPPPVGENGGEGGVGGLATSADIWIAADATTRDDADGTRVNEPIFVHEYVHTRQNYTAGRGLAWLSESSAFYYMGMLPHRRGATLRERFDRRFRVPERHQEAVLTETTTTDYQVWATKGARTVAGLDRRIRAATGGSRTLQDVLRRVNDHEGNVTYADLRGMVVVTAGEEPAVWLDRHADGPTPAPEPVPDAYPASNATVDPAGAEWRRGDEWVPLSTTPLPAGIPVQVRHPDVGVVVRPGDGTTTVDDPDGDPATVRFSPDEATLRVETFYGRQSTVVEVAASEDVDGDDVSNAAELDQGSDPYDASSSTASTGPDTGDGGTAGTGTAPLVGDGPGFGLAGALAALALLAAALGAGRRGGN